MILDERTEFADATSVAASAGTAVIGDVIDLGATSPGDIGIGEPIWFVIQVSTSFVAAGTGSIRFYLVSDSLATLGAATAASCTIHFDTGTLATATSPPAGQTAGSVICAFRVPSGTYERYLGVLCTIATQTVSAGAINAFLTRDYAKWTAMADASN